VDPEGVIERLWPGRPAAIEPLGGGITNHNYLVRVDDQTVVLRIGGKDTDLLGIDRHAEEAASRMAAFVGVGPEIVAFVESEGYLVTRFIEGSPIPPERMRTRGLIARVADALRAVHSADPIPGRFDAHHVVEVYRDTAAAHGVPIPDDVAWAMDVAARIRRVRGAAPPVPCHNDLLNANFIDDGQRIRIVDWEYAGMGDAFFDLANFSINHEFEAEHDDALLLAYTGAVRDADLGSLRLMRFMSDFREAMWGIVQQGISDLAFDFAGYAQEHFDRLRATEAAPGFRAALDA
jgi:thiamine kinase-like enzyme